MQGVANLYAPGTGPALAAVHGVPTHHGQVRWTGKWANPPGWTGRLMWNGLVTRYSGRPGAPEIPDLFFVADYADYQHNLQPPTFTPEGDGQITQGGGPGWKDASELPAELRHALLDYYGTDLTAGMRELCAAQIAEREAAAAAATAAPKAAARPEARQKRDRHRDDAGPRAGAALAPATRAPGKKVTTKTKSKGGRKP